MKIQHLVYIWIILLKLISVSNAKHDAHHHALKLLICPCDTDKLCAKSSNGYAICNCWTRCNEDCPPPFDRIDETTEYCHYGDTRSRCSTTILCDNHKAKSKEDEDTKLSSSATKHFNSSHNALIGQTDEDIDDSGYFKLSIVGFILWQIASIGLGMLICGCASEYVSPWVQNGAAN
eukprot:511383_1